jgi:hemoglobin
VTTTESATRPLFERLGGEAAIEAAVVDFYERVMDDPTLAPFFAHLDMEAQIKKQIAFMTMAFGGPNKYTGKDLRTAHAKLVKTGGLGDSHFDAIAHHLKTTLLELGVDEATTSEVLHVVGTTRNDVLNR